LPTYSTSQFSRRQRYQHDRNIRRQISHARRVVSRQVGPYQSTQSSLYPVSMGISPVESLSIPGTPESLSIPDNRAAESLLVPGNRSSSDRGTQPRSSEINGGLDIEAIENEHRAEIHRGVLNEHRSPDRYDGGSFMAARISSNLNQRQSRLFHRRQDQFSKFL